MDQSKLDNFSTIAQLLGIVIVISVATELLSYHQVYKHEEYKDLVERTKNL